MSDTYRVTGMTCGGCARAVTQAITEAAPKASVQVDLDRQAVTVDGADEALVKAAIDAAGFGFEGRI
ncbi:heavy-metal-associated domain-containing protein [Magnetospirillum fulvum]|jgi:copper chaperone|uniref:Copper chaperone n=1 Tax=Magnetospirillum fulvum MGU-K5 TaxID=1316936 RepID=S9TDF3_MAGFU|nr:heavy-metal-associated domain-containing protein [Magnetospirillum fulvum]EPY00261.1 copper chaperone [Magnetospirillum fulvum MGU-K5]